MSTVESTWELISSGDLFSGDKLAELKGEFARMPPGNHDVLNWLKKQREITDYHARVFSAGHSGPFRYGDYVVHDRVEEGYFKGGFRARHSSTDHPVVLSFVTDEQATTHWPRLQAMANATQYFNSPFLVRCFDAVEVNEFKFLVFEDFDSVPVASILAKNGQLKPKTASDIVRRVALALQTIHQAGYSHGHVSSQQVRIQEGTSVKLFFDPNYFFIPLVKVNQHPDPLSLVQVDYSAPELAVPGNRPDELTDIYALGCLFYELLSGKPPYPIGSVQDRMQQHAKDKPKPLENLGYDKNLAQFVYFMMAKERRLRFQSVSDVIQQLNELADSGNAKPRAPKALPTYQAFDAHIRAILANESKSGRISPTNLLPSAQSPNVSITSASVARQPVVETKQNNPPEFDSPPATASHPEQVSGQGGSAVASQQIASKDAPVQLQMDDEERSTTSSYRNRQKSSFKKTLVPLGITVLILAVPLTLAYMKYGDQLFGAVASSGDEDQDPDESGEDLKPDEKNGQGTGPVEVSVSNVVLIEDDERTLWESPTDGQPLQLNLTPPGMRLLFSVRGAALFEEDTEALMLKSLGPEFQKLASQIETAAGISWKETERIEFSVHDNNVDGQDELLFALNIKPVDQKPLVYWLAKWGECEKQETTKGAYYNSSNGWSYYSPDSETIGQFLIGPESLVKAIVEEGGALPHPSLPPLLKTTDQNRHLNLLFIPTDLTSPSGITLFNETWLPVTNLMSWFLGGEDKIQCAFISMHFDSGDVYLEAGLRPQLEKDPHTLADELRERIADAPNRVMKYMLDVDADRHWKMLAFEIPDWIKSLSGMTRVGVENRMTFANCWQEQAAAHNLLAGLEYTLAFANGGSSVAPPPVPAKKTPQTLEELLATNRTIEIANDDLNIAVDKIVGEVKDEYPKLPFDFQIVINGTHLMEEGITKNQRLVNFKVENKPLGDILADFVFQANTDKTSTGPSDPKTMLIWVVNEMQPGKKVVLITTRTAATREGYKLPKQFVPQ